MFRAYLLFHILTHKWDAFSSLSIVCPKQKTSEVGYAGYFEIYLILWSIMALGTSRRLLGSSRGEPKINCGDLGLIQKLLRLHFSYYKCGYLLLLEIAWTKKKLLVIAKHLFGLANVLCYLPYRCYGSKG